MDNDFIDAANTLAARLADTEVALVRGLVPTPVEIDETEEPYCESCGSELDIRRARLGFTVCVDCAEYIEKTARRTRVRSYDE